MRKSPDTAPSGRGLRENHHSEREQQHALQANS